ncbi:MAG TPA: hypothetical protein DCW68_06995 [Rhodospirillaceae bacterium]|nr:hypothetical protein [Rhodospirillaceae bacterium]
MTTITYALAQFFLISLFSGAGAIMASGLTKREWLEDALIWLGCACMGGCFIAVVLLISVKVAEL